MFAWPFTTSRSGALAFSARGMSAPSSLAGSRNGVASPRGRTPRALEHQVQLADVEHHVLAVPLRGERRGERPGLQRLELQAAVDHEGG